MKTPILVALLLLGTMAYATPAQAVLIDAVACPNTDDEYRTGNAQCVFTCGGSDTLFVTADADQALDRITGEAECGGAIAKCVESSSRDCEGKSNELTTRAHNAGACKATGFDPWWAGEYELTANCWSEWDRSSNPNPARVFQLVQLRATILDGIVMQSSGVNLVTGETFAPVVSVEKMVEGSLITIST